MSSDTPLRPMHVLVVDDSAVVRQTLLGLLSATPDLTAEAAPDPLIAMQKMQLRRPDVIVLDLEMPRMDGMTFLRKLMRENPLPVIICSGLVGDRSAAALRALDEGAVDVIGKPRVGLKTFLHDSSVMLVDAIRGAAMANIRRLPRPEPGAADASVVLPRIALRAEERRNCRVIAIGASTGGPDAIAHLLGALPARMPGVVIVQHMPEAFTASFARRLDEMCELQVKEAVQGDEIRTGTVLVARGDHHLVVYRHGSSLYTDVVRGPLVSRHRPSVDVLFRSVAQTAGADAIGILLTGMGDDGAAGMHEMREAGAWTIAESEESSAVFGMPRAAIARGAAAEIIPITGVAQSIVQRIDAEPATGRPT